MQTNLYLVRHAHSTYTSDEINRPLSVHGLNDAKGIIELLKNERIDQVISSPYKRAVQTVAGIAKFKDQEIEIIDGFRERKLLCEPVSDFSNAIAAVWKDWDFSWDGGESNFIAQKRGIKATNIVLEKYKGKNIVIGTHGNIMVLIMNYFDKQYDLDFWKQLQMPDTYQLSFQENNFVKIRHLFIPD